MDVCIYSEDIKPRQTGINAGIIILNKDKGGGIK
jgi:hypothetical protein